MTTVNNIYTYMHYAVVEKEDGSLVGYRILLNKEQQEAIEDIITSMTVNLIEEEVFELEVQNEDG